MRYKDRRNQFIFDHKVAFVHCLGLFTGEPTLCLVLTTHDVARYELNLSVHHIQNACKESCAAQYKDSVSW